jgi:hypothetical protein
MLACERGRCDCKIITSRIFSPRSNAQQEEYASSPSRQWPVARFEYALPIRISLINQLSLARLITTIFTPIVRYSYLCYSAHKVGDGRWVVRLLSATRQHCRGTPSRAPSIPRYLFYQQLFHSEPVSTKRTMSCLFTKAKSLELDGRSGEGWRREVQK